MFQTSRSHHQGKRLPDFFKSFVDSASLYNLVNKANLVNDFRSKYIFSLYISGDYVPIRKNNCIYATLGTCHYVWMNDMQGAYQSSTQSDKYQVSHRYSYFSWWWAHSRPKHVEKRNTHTKKIVHQVGFIYKITRLPDDDPSRIETCSSLIVLNIIQVHNYKKLCICWWLIIN
jgi:hypothetical protein